MSNRSNTRWGARQPPRRGGGGYDQNYDDYNYNQQQYAASGYEYDYDSYNQSQSNYDRGSASSKRFSSNRGNYESGTNYYNNPPPRHAKGNFAENNPNNNKSNPSVTKKPTKKQESDATPPVLPKEPEPEPIGK